MPGAGAALRKSALVTPSSCFQVQPDGAGPRQPLLHPLPTPLSTRASSAPARLHLCASGTVSSVVAHHPEKINFSGKSEALPPQSRSARARRVSPLQMCASLLWSRLSRRAARLSPVSPNHLYRAGRDSSRVVKSLQSRD